MAEQSTSAAEGAFGVGDAVQVSCPLPYLKTADPMPMLRPPDLLDAGEIGHITEIRQSDQVAVQFRRGTFLLPLSALTAAPP